MSESALGTFRIDKDLWNKFQELAKSRDSNASKLIVGFIEACIENRIDIHVYTSAKLKPKSENPNGSIDKYLDAHIDRYLDKNLDDRIDLNLEVRIDRYLDKILDDHVSVCLDKSDLPKIVDRLVAIEAEMTDLKTMLVKVPSPPPLALESPQQVESVTTNQDPTNWEGSIADLVSTGMSSRQIEIQLNLLGFTTSKGTPFSRQSIEGYLSRRPDLKAIYENARKEGTKCSDPQY